MEIIPNVHLVADVIANCYLIRDTDGLTLIDAGIPGSQKRILNYIRGLGFAPIDLKRVLITHADFDHTGGLAALKKVSGATVCASQMEADAIAIGRSSRRLKPKHPLRKILYGFANRYVKTAPVEVDDLLVDGQVIDVFGGLQVVATAGHTPGHLSFFAPAAGILFSGDSIVSDEEGLHPSVRDNTWDNTKASESVRKQAALGALIVCPGHGPVIKDALGRYPRA